MKKSGEITKDIKTLTISKETLLRCSEAKKLLEEVKSISY